MAEGSPDEPVMTKGGLLVQSFVERFQTDPQMKDIIKKGTDNGIGVDTTDAYYGNGLFNVLADRGVQIDDPVEVDSVNVPLDGLKNVAVAVTSPTLVPQAVRADTVTVSASEAADVPGKGDLSPNDFRLIYSIVDSLPNEMGIAGFAFPTDGTLRRSDIMNRDDLSFTNEFSTAFRENSSKFSDINVARIEALITRLDSKPSLPGNTLGFDDIRAIHGAVQALPNGDDLIIRDGVVDQISLLAVSGRADFNEATYSPVSASEVFNSISMPRVNPNIAPVAPELAVAEVPVQNAQTKVDTSIAPVSSSEAELQATREGNPVTGQNATGIPSVVDKTLPPVDMLGDREEMPDYPLSVSRAKALDAVLNPNDVPSTLSTSTTAPPVGASTASGGLSVHTSPIAFDEANTLATLASAMPPLSGGVTSAMPHTQNSVPTAMVLANAKDGVPEGYVLGATEEDGMPDALYRDVSYTKKEMQELYRVADILNWKNGDLRETFIIGQFFDPKAVLNADLTISQEFFAAAKEAQLLNGKPTIDPSTGKPVDPNFATLAKMEERVSPEETVVEGYDAMTLFAYSRLIKDFVGEGADINGGVMIIRQGRMDPALRSYTVSDEAGGGFSTFKYYFSSSDMRTEAAAVERFTQWQNGQELPVINKNVIVVGDAIHQAGFGSMGGLRTSEGKAPDVEVQTSPVPVQAEAASEKPSNGYSAADLDDMRTSLQVPFSDDAPDLFNSADVLLLRDVATGFLGGYVLGADGQPTPEFKEHAEGQHGYTGEYVVSSPRPSAKSVIEALENGTIHLPGKAPAVKAAREEVPKIEPEQRATPEVDVTPVIPSSDTTTLVRISKDITISALAEAAGVDVSNWADVKPYLEAVAHLNGTTREALEHVEVGQEYYLPNSVDGKSYDYRRSDISSKAIVPHPGKNAAIPDVVEGDFKLDIDKGDTLYEIVRDLAKANGVDNTSYAALKGDIEAIAKASGITDMKTIQIGKEIDISGDIFGADKNLNIPRSLTDNYERAQKS